MPARRIIAISPDGAFGAALSAALRGAAETVDVQPALGALGAPGTGEPPPALCVIHVDGELARTPGELEARLPADCPVIAVLPRASLAAAVELMQAQGRVAAVVAAEELDPRQLAALAARIAADDVLGLDKVMAPGTEIHTRSVGDHRDKTACMAAVAELVERAGVPRRYREPIEQCLDEMLMNALYDAPVDAQGKHIFAGIPTRLRITMRTEQRVTVQYACDGKQLAIAVRDAFGALDRQTVLRHLHKGLHAAQQVDRKAGGAGLGLYLMASSAAAVHFHVLPGIATEAICCFDLQAPRPRLAQLAFVVQRDAAGQRPTGPARRLRVGARRRAWVLAAIAAAIAAPLGALALSWGAGGAPPAAAPATVELDSEPTGAAVELDGRPAGSTPLTLTELPPGATVSIVLRRSGYRAATLRLQVPARGEVARHVQPLALADDLVRVRFVSNPPGAVVTRTGEAATTDRTYTPADVFVEADRVQRFTLTMPRHVPLVIEPFTPARGAHGLEKGGDLVPGATLRMEAAAGGKVTVAGAPHCVDLAVPADCTLAPGSYTVEHVGPDGARAARTVMMTTQDATFRIDPGRR